MKPRDNSIPPRKMENAGLIARVFHSAVSPAVLKLTYPIGAPAP
jgi:hypothetical protein